MREAVTVALLGTSADDSPSRRCLLLKCGPVHDIWRSAAFDGVGKDEDPGGFYFGVRGLLIGNLV